LYNFKLDFDYNETKYSVTELENNCMYALDTTFVKVQERTF